MPRISIIIPVFNAEKTISSSLESLLRQEGDFEVVFVNDGSTDGTAEVIERFISGSKLRYKLLSQENQGVAAARNTGLEAAQGDYLMFLDADDGMSDDAVRTVMDSVAGDYDVIGWDWIQLEGERRRQMRQAEYATPSDALDNLMNGTMKWNLWLFAVRREIVNRCRIRFIPGADMGEDMMFMLKSFACADNCHQLRKELYRYNASNPASISNTMNERRRKEVSENLSEAVSFLSGSAYADQCAALLPSLKLYVKRPLLIGTSFSDYRTWYGWFPEANRFSGKNKALPFHTRLLQALAAKRLYLLVYIYNVVVYKVLYKIIHR